MSVFTNPASSSREDAKSYTAAVLGLLGDQKPFDVLSRTPAALSRAIRGVSPRQLGRREAPAKWSIKQVLRHLADSEVVWAWRLRLILAHDRPTITGYDQDAWANRLGYADASASESLADFTTLRKSNLRLVKRASPADLQRVGIHSERGEESVAHLVKLYAGHDILHLNQIARIRKSFQA